jgi:hypothetical protein
LTSISQVNLQLGVGSLAFNLKITQSHINKHVSKPHQLHTQRSLTIKHGYLGNLFRGKFYSVSTRSITDAIKQAKYVQGAGPVAKLTIARWGRNEVNLQKTAELQELLAALKLYPPFDIQEIDGELLKQITRHAEGGDPMESRQWVEMVAMAEEMYRYKVTVAETKAVSMLDVVGIRLINSHLVSQRKGSRGDHRTERD